MYIPDDMAWAFSSGDYYEKNVIFFLDKIFAKYNRPVFYDAGANYGYYSLRYSSQSNRVFSFEPVRATNAILRQNIEDNHAENIRVFDIGLSDKSGTAEINIYNSCGNNSIFERAVPSGHSLKKLGVESVRLASLDDLILAESLPDPDIIKIDVEGAELHVLKGALTAISRSLPTILFEYGATTSSDAGYSREDLLDCIDTSQYNIYGIPDDVDDIRLISHEKFDAIEVSNIIFFPKKKGQIK
jgi:FkbM family methyltransferase